MEAGLRTGSGEERSQELRRFVDWASSLLHGRPGGLWEKSNVSSVQILNTKSKGLQTPYL